MATEEPHSLAHSLNSTPVDRKLVDILFAQGIISKPAYDFSRNLIDQPRQWNAWLMRFFGVIGGVLILSSLVGFAQFFWQYFPHIYPICHSIGDDCLWSVPIMPSWKISEAKSYC